MSLKNVGPIPNRWLYCPRKSDTIIAKRFLALKTPLDKNYGDQIPMQCLFLPEMIFEYCKLMKLKLGLWIDLTNTNRFYNRSIVERKGATYIKLKCRGHAETPSPEQTTSFIETVDNFITDHPSDIIAVHCTHGFNRTGFLIASYLVEKRECSVEAALAIFAKARAPGIYKQDYINELFRRYENEKTPPTAPKLPDWCLDDDGSNGNSGSTSDRKREYCYDDDHSSTSQQTAALYAEPESDYNHHDKEDIGKQLDDDGADDAVDDVNNSEASGVDGNPPKKRRRREKVIKNATFMAGVPGVTQVTQQPLLSNLQYKVQEMCKWEQSGFPGSQPVSMDNENIKRLREKPYVVSWKADGTRYMMLINKRNEIYFFDRNYSCFQVHNLTFPLHNKIDGHLENTLVDGEMVLDKHQGQVTPRYLIYDIIMLLNKDVGSEHFSPNRLEIIKKKVIEPRQKAMAYGKIDRQSEPFSVRNKEFWPISKSASLLGEKFAKKLSHEPDGLIFQPSEDPYKTGVCFDVFKWKPHQFNSIDFRLKVTVETGQGILPRKIGELYVAGMDTPFGQLQKLTKNIRELDNKIIECTLHNQGKWEFLRERTDRKTPNSYNTAIAVLESIRKPVTKEKLLNFIRQIDSEIENERRQQKKT